MSCVSSVSAPSTPTEQIKQNTNVCTKKKGKCNNRVHFPADDILVTCYLEPPDPWSRVYGNTFNTLITAYLAASDKQGIKPLVCVLEQLQEFESNFQKLESNSRAFDLSILGYIGDERLLFGRTSIKLSDSRLAVSVKGEKLSLRHCEALEEVLRRLQFNLVDLEGCYLEDEGAAAFFDMIEYYDSAVQLNISFTKHIDCRGWQACSRMLKKTTSLVHLNARSTGLNEQVLLIVGRALRLSSNLVTLHLENCGIYGRCLVILVAALKLNTTLRELFLAENKISAADAFLLGNLLRTNTHLELLDLSNNKLGDDGLVHVMESLGQQSNTSGRGLSILILWNNELTVKGMPCVSRALTSARALRRLNLGSNAISSAGVIELKQNLICNRTIEILELENAQITSEGANALAEYISQNQYLQKLDIFGNDIRLNGLKSLSLAMHKNQNVISLKVNPTSMDLSEPLKDRQNAIQEINKFCQRNKEAKNSLPPQDAQLSTLFNGIFSHVLPTHVSTPDVVPSNCNKVAGNNPSTSLKSRFRVSMVILKNEENASSIPVHPTSLDLGYIAVDNGFIPNNNACHLSDILVTEPVSPKNLMTDYKRQDPNISDASTNHQETLASETVQQSSQPNNHAMDKGFVRKDAFAVKELKISEMIGNNINAMPEVEQKVRRLSSPTLSTTAPPATRKTHSIKCCKELEGLDLRSTVPLSPTHLHKSFNFPESDVSEVALNPPMNMKASQTVYMVH